MAEAFLHLLLLLSIRVLLLHGRCGAASTPPVHPQNCTGLPTRACDAYLYLASAGRRLADVHSLYSVNASSTMPISRGGRQDYLLAARCTCTAVGGGTVAYFHRTSYRVLPGDSPDRLTFSVFGGQAWNVSADLQPHEKVAVYLVCGCPAEGDGADAVVTTYTVQENDTLSGIAGLLSSDVVDIVRANGWLIPNTGYILPGWVLLVPRVAGSGPAVSPPGVAARNSSKAITISVATAMAFLVAGLVFFIIFRRRRALRENIEAPTKTISKPTSAKVNLSFGNQYPQRDGKGDGAAFESERPLKFSLVEVEEATAGFHETRKLGEGGYGSVYFGILRTLEVAIKRMKSSKSKEFFAELKVLCKVHHINVVELIGYAAGKDNLYLVYEYVQNGSLSDHLHDPLLKGHQPLSWTARARVALDSARGIEYIHDHTKARYVHRDIKTSNILLDEGLRAKVADFGLAKLVDLTEGEEFIATRLVGTPGYLPPESVRELQMTTKCDVFAFGVVLAELISGRRALIRDDQQPTRLISLLSIINRIFREEDPVTSLEAIVDGNLKGICPIEEVLKMADLAAWCSSEDAVDRPEMGVVVEKLSQILVSSMQWEASLGGDSEVFSGVLDGR